MIVELFFPRIIFLGLPRTAFLCALSLGIVFSMRNAGIKEQVGALVRYELIVLFIFLWIFIAFSFLIEFEYEGMISTAKWELVQIFSFTISTIMQLMIYNFLWKKNKVLKVVTILLSAAIMCCVLYFVLSFVA